MATQTGKKYKAALSKVDRNKRYTIGEAFKLLKETTDIVKTKYDQTVDVAINLGIDPKHADQMVRGAVVLPHGTGKSMRVAVFAKGEKQAEAQNAGADVVGEADLAKKIEEGFMDFDTVIATPDMMGVVGRLGKVLGPRGLMPNPKTGTVTMDLAKAVRESKGGKIEFRAEKAGIVHAPVGKASFAAEKLAENFNTLIDLVMKMKPATAKGVYLKGVTVSATMGPGIKVDTTEVSARHKYRGFPSFWRRPGGALPGLFIWAVRDDTCLHALWTARPVPRGCADEAVPLGGTGPDEVQARSAPLRGSTAQRTRQSLKGALEGPGR
jgi:large subunit ribosomal protein L1